MRSRSAGKAFCTIVDARRFRAALRHAFAALAMKSVIPNDLSSQYSFKHNAAT
jgi:hypothetical protein